MNVFNPLHGLVGEAGSIVVGDVVVFGIQHVENVKPEFHRAPAVAGTGVYQPGIIRPDGIVLDQRRLAKIAQSGAETPSVLPAGIASDDERSFDRPRNFPAPILLSLFPIAS